MRRAAGATHVNFACEVSAGAELVLREGHELRPVFTQPGAEPERYEHLDLDSFYLKPMDGDRREENTRLAVRYCLEHPLWRPTLQTHKMPEIP